ncbi:uncharacterized protein si:ch211-195m9.3 isoform X2 [Scophthalmus maximus]|uniref:uncharacterized protein si:ch211-195m9.3 isoform X2 n=1 Tax=Scophthalmus maximus TaxID=52904 RepID=UPI001FA90508|nr:uncharacterized protein si:ch211-195m9.3 isoform X2 [Scophthalmus maximus]
MSPLWAPGLVWLICSITSPPLRGHAMESSGAAKKACGHRKTCMGIVYDIDEAVCCENRLHPGAGLSCCGKEPFNLTLATCCKERHGGTLTATVSVGLSEKVSACCGLQAYNPLNEICCQSTVAAKPVPMAQCCGTRAFDEEEQLCCGKIHDKMILTRTSKRHKCCGHDQYDTMTHCCCGVTDVLQIQLIQSKCCEEYSAQILQPKFCGKVTFDVERQLCCGPIHDKNILNRTSSRHRCCSGHDQYDTATECCFMINGVLTVQGINSTFCQNDPGGRPKSPAPRPYCTEPDTSLCGSLCYNPEERHCCERNQTMSHWCCNSGPCDATPTVYNPRTHVCCDGCLSEWKPWLDQFHGSPGQHCCGTETYRPHSEICCNGHRHPKVENGHCCGIHTYNIKDPQMKCCARTLYNLSSLGKHWLEAQCCGSILQTPQNQNVCCSSEDEELLYSKKKGLRCCGHLYYDTSLWSCCAGKLRPAHQPGQDQAKMNIESRFQSVNNLNKTYLCEEMKIGTVESASLRSIVFTGVLKIHGVNATVKALPSPYILNTTDRCNSPLLIPGKAYFFDGFKVFTDFNHDTSLLSVHYIISRCYHL